MRRLLCLLLTLPGLLSAQSSAESRLRRDVAILASPRLEGRGNGTPGLEAAAEHLVKAYRSLGLQPEVQRIPFIHRVERVEATARLGHGDLPVRTLQWGVDVEAYGFSGDKHFAPKALVFAGYGLTTPDHDDLADLSLRGRVVMVLRKVPDLPAFAGVSQRDRSVLARVQHFQLTGASAVIFIEEGDLPRPLAREEGPSQFRIPVLSMPLRALESACADLPQRAAELAAGKGPRSRDYSYAPWSHLSLALRLERKEAKLPSVVARIPGRDPRLKDEAIVLAAHLDHLGLGERHSRAGDAGRGKVHPGADDNASGTAMVLELARTLKRRPARRSVVLLHVPGEEEGLLGSAHWIQNPTLPLPSVKFMVNFDMVGRLDPAKPTLLMGGLGAPKSALERAKSFAPRGLAIAGDLGMAVGGSDHMSFAAARIPTFFFFTGVHGDYHRPTDTPDRLNYPGMAKVASFALKVVRDLADAPELPAFDPETAKLPTGSGSPVRVAFGSIPDFAEHPKGFRINGTTPGSPAEGLGLKAGDVITSFGGRPIRTLYDFQEALSAFKPGDTVKVQWLRGEASLEGQAVLRGR